MQIELNSTPAQPLLLNTIAPSAHSGTRGQTGQGCLCRRAPPLLEDPQVAGGAGARKATLLQATGPSGGAGWSQGPSWGRPHSTLPLGSPVCSCKAFPWGAYGPNSTGRPQTLSGLPRARRGAPDLGGKCRRDGQASGHAGTQAGRQAGPGRWQWPSRPPLSPAALLGLHLHLQVGVGLTHGVSGVQGREAAASGRKRRGGHPTALSPVSLN